MGRIFATGAAVATGLLLAHPAVIAATPGPYRWASTGGGWRAMVADMGFANLFHQAGLIGGQQQQDGAAFSAISVTSGACWFGTQFFYSQNFYSKTVEGTADDLKDFVVEWMGTYLNYTETAGILDGIDDPTLEFLGPFDDIDVIKELLSVLKLLEATQGDWAGFIADMLAMASTLSYDDPGFATRKANSANRIDALKEVDLIAQTTLTPQSRNRTLESLVNLGPNDSDQVYAVVLPVTYSVGSASLDPEGAGFVIGGGEGTLPLNTYVGQAEKDFSYKDYKGYYLYPGTGGSILTGNILKARKPKKKKMMMAMKPKKAMMTMKPKMTATSKKVGNMGKRYIRGLRGFKGKKRAGTAASLLRPPFGGDPTTAQIAAISSAAAGGFSPLIPSTFAQITSWIRSEFVPDFLVGAFDDAVTELYQTRELDGFAVCSQYPEPCGENDATFIDGGYTDNPAFVMNIAQYQEGGGSPDETIKIVLTNTNEGKFDPNPEILPYFSTKNNSGVEPGQYIWGQFVSVMSQQIFDRRMNTTGLLALEEFTDDGSTVSTVTLTGLKTVDNPMYGVKAGYTVDLLIINTNTDVTTYLVGSELIKFYTPILANLAAGDIASNGVLLQRVKDFFVI